MLHSFAPQKFRELSSVKHCLYLLKKHTIEPFRHSIILGHVMNSKASQSSRFGKMFIKSGTEIFASMITVKLLNVSSTLHPEFSLVDFLSVEKAGGGS